MGVYVNTKNTILNASFGKANTITLAPVCYLGLSTTTPSDDGTNFTEPSSAAGYTRCKIGDYATSTDQIITVSNGTATNSSAIIFQEASVSWGTITHFGVFSTLTGGVPIITGALSSPIAVPANFTPLFRPTKFTVSII